MTQSTFLADNQGSKHVCQSGLFAAVRQHIAKERASFHTPGHKGRLALDIAGAQFAADLTEVPGLDELANAGGVLKDLQARMSCLWKSRRSFISVNGASAALTAAILSCAGRGSEILLPANVHRSALNALIMSGLEPVWYEPDWLENWGTWGATSVETLEKLLTTRVNSLAAVAVTSPNYAGLLSDIEKISCLCRKHNIVLIVDEAHGAHLLNNKFLPENALSLGADLVVHSLHKTLSAPSQTGVLHLGKDCPINEEVAKSALNMLQSSSPSYLLMLGIETALSDLERDSLRKVRNLADSLREQIGRETQFELLDRQHSPNDPLHLLLAHRDLSGQQFYDALAAKGIYAETVLGRGILLLLGLGSTDFDLDLLIDALASINSENTPAEGAAPAADRKISRPPACLQQLNPRQAFFAGSEAIPVKLASGRIACDWIAPCPPGYPLVSPGQLISPETIKFLENNTSIRVVKHPQLEGDSDGTNTAC